MKNLIDELFEDPEIQMMDSEYRFRAWLREVGLDDRNARQQFKKDVNEL